MEENLIPGKPVSEVSFTVLIGLNIGLFFIICTAEPYRIEAGPAVASEPELS